MFKKARLKLTAWYLFIIMAVSISFSLIIYRVLLLEVLRFERAQRFRIERRINLFEAPIPANPELIEEVKQRIIFRLFILNAGIFILSGGAGYFLAGKTLSPIQEMVDEQNRFITDASHEFRTPLTSLKSAMEVHLRDKKLTLLAAKKLVSENLKDVDKLQRLSDSLLQLAQYQHSDQKVIFGKIDINRIITAALSKIKYSADKKQIKLKYQGQSIIVTGDKEKLTDLLIILLDNAVKYSHPRQTVTVDARKTDGSLLLSVKDDGIGIDKKDLPFIFDRFYRTDNSRTKKSTDGYGLGLSIAKKIAELHKAEISVDSQLNSGTTFILNLPLQINKQ